MDEFISRNAGLNDPGIVVGSSESLGTVASLFEERDFQTITNPTELLEGIEKGGKIILSSDQLATDAVTFFDIIQGFTTGSIDVDGVHVAPQYERLNIIVLATPQFIEDEQNEGRDWMTLCGMAYQYSA